VERPFRGPEVDGDFLDAKQAARWLGDISPDLFEQLMAEHLPTLRAVYMGRLKYWRWEDVAVLAYILARATTNPTAPKGKKGPEEATQT
jgi:hypothetical protein